MLKFSKSFAKKQLLTLPIVVGNELKFTSVLHFFPSIVVYGSEFKGKKRFQLLLLFSGLVSKHEYIVRDETSGYFNFPVS